MSVPLGNGLSVTVATGQDAPALAEIKNNAMSTNVTMGDDDFVVVPLPFTFTYWGQDFTSSRMYSNGVVNFTANGVPANYCCNGQDLSKLSDTQYNYSIMALWTDLIAQNGGSHYVLSSTSAVTYGWYGVSEFGTNNRSSFEVKIDATGLVDIRFSGALVERGVTSGLTGDLAQGQYYQYHHGGMLTISALGWSLPGTTVMTPDPCAQPLTTPGCPGFVGTMATESATVIAEPAVQVLVAPATSLPAVTSSSAVVPGPGTLSTTAAALSPVREGRPGVSTSQVISTVRSEQSRINSLETAVLDQAAQRADRAQQEAQTTALGSSLLQQQSGVVSSRGSVTEDVAARGEVLREQAPRAASQNEQRQDSAVEAMVNPGLALPGMRDSGSALSQSDAASTQNTTVNRNAAANEVAGGVDITQLARAPSGFAQYQLGMPDGQGYQPKEIYRNQTVVDNQRLLRGLTGATDRVHQEMMQQQYR